MYRRSGERSLMGERSHGEESGGSNDSFSPFRLFSPFFGLFFVLLWSVRKSGDYWRDSQLVTMIF